MYWASQLIWACKVYLAPCCSEVWVLPCWLKLNISIIVCAWYNKITCIHVTCACVTVYWALPLILSFQVMIRILRTLSMIIIVMISWGMAQTSRSVPTSFPTRLVTYLFYAYLLRELCEDLYFRILRDTLLFILWDTFKISFTVACVRMFLLVLIWYKLVFIYETYIYVSSLLSGAVFENMFLKFLKVMFLLFRKTK